MRVIARPLTEKQFLGMVRELAHLHGWLTYHTHDSRRSSAGFPDLILVRVDPEGWGELLAVELKRDGRPLTAAQRQWLKAFQACGIGGGVWHPSDWPLIELTLRRD